MSGEQVSGEQMSSEHISLVGEQMSSGSLTGEQVSDEHLSVGEHLSSEQMSYLRFRVSKCLVSKCHGTAGGAQNFVISERKVWNSGIAKLKRIRYQNIFTNIRHVNNTLDIGII